LKCQNGFHPSGPESCLRTTPRDGATGELSAAYCRQRSRSRGVGPPEVTRRPRSLTMATDVDHRWQRQPCEVGVCHADGFAVRPGSELEVLARGIRAVHKDLQPVQVAEGWNRSNLAVVEQTREQLLIRQVDLARMQRYAQLSKMYLVCGGQDHQQRLGI